MMRFRKSAWLMVAVLLISLLVTGCGGKKHKKSNSDSSTNVTLTLDNGSLLTDNLANTNNWEFLNGASGKIEGGVLKVTAPSSANNQEGIAMRLKDDVWAKMGSPTSYYVEMLIKPGFPTTGNKNIGIASNISSTGSTWYYAGFNANSRIQAGTWSTPKGYQNSNDKLKFVSEADSTYYKWRYEYNNGIINFYCNDLYMGKTTGDGYLGLGLANYDPVTSSHGTSTGTIGIYSCGASFEIAAIRVGLPTQQQSKLVLKTTDSTLPLLWGKFAQRINNTSSTGIRVNDKVDIQVIAFDSSGNSGSWSATTTNANILSLSASSGLSKDTLTITGKGVGTATVIITNTTNPNNKRSITYFVDEKLKYVDDTYTGINNLVYPAIGTTTAYTDGEIAITFDSTPVIKDTTGVVLIKKYSDDSLVDTIKFSNDKATVSGRGTTEINYGSQRIRVVGNILYIAPHDGVLTYGTQYYVAIPNEVITGTFGGKTFTGFNPTQKTWNFTTKSNAGVSGTTITVDGSQNSTANFRTIQAALTYATNVNNAVIEITPGTYRELLTYKKDYNVTLKGKGNTTYGTDVIIEYANGDRVNSGTVMRPVAYFSTTGNVTFSNLTIKNTGAKASYGQAEALFLDRDSGSYFVAKNCSFISQQDTLQTKGYNWFYQCYVEGDTDFIWGYAKVSLFEDCTIHAISNGSWIFHARTQKADKGYVLYNCDIKSDVDEVSYFARGNNGTSTTSDFYNNVSVIDCRLTGEGTITSWYDAEPPAEGVGTATYGWKYYNITKNGSAQAITSTKAYQLTSSEYTSGWSTRALILGSWTPTEP